MNTSFLEKLAKEITSEHGSDLSQLLFIFPSKRAGIFFKKEIAKKLDTPIWAPEIVTISEFVETLSGLQLSSQLEQAFLLFAVHQQEGFEPQLPLERFLDQAKIMLADFNDMDMALADVDDLFTHVKDMDALDRWEPSGEGESLTEIYLDSWEKLPPYYHAYTHFLLERKKAYQGLMYRTLNKRISDGNGSVVLNTISNYKGVFLAGINAQTKAEKWLFDWLKKEIGLTVYYEVEAQMVRDSDQESGKFLRTVVEEEKENFKWVEDRLTGSQKNIHTYAVNGNLAIARTAGKLLSEKEAHGLSNNQDTAVILADENLLMPVLESIPKGINEINVTLGFPLSLTSFMTLVEQVFSMHQLARVEGPDTMYYFKDVLKVCTNPVLLQLHHDNADLSNVSQSILEENRIWIGEKELKPLFEQTQWSEAMTVLIENWHEKPRLSIQFIQQIIRHYQDTSAQMGQDDLLMEQLYYFKRAMQVLDEYLSMYNWDLSLEAIHRVLKQIVNLAIVPFSGEPLAGIQVMGLLETRLLQFKNVIFLSVNEGIIPSKGGFQSYLPFQIRKSYHIQTHQDQESLFAYHFYRVLTQAENIHLVYNTSDDGVGANEKSRFIRQIEQEWPNWSPNITFDHSVGIWENNQLNIHKEISKTPKVIENITSYLTSDKRGLSPSALNTYLESPIDFYYGQVARIQEPDEVNEEMEHNTFGTIVHNCLEEFYKPFEKQVLNASALKERVKDLPEIINEKFTEKIPVYHFGKHYLSFYSVETYVKRFIRLDIERVEQSVFPITLVANEMELRGKMMVDGLEVKLKGYADRIEQIQGVTHIIDYKTGAVKQTDLKIASWDDLTSTVKPKLNQLLMYAWLAHDQLGAQEVVSGIYTLRAANMNLLTAQVEKQMQMGKEDFEEIQTYLTSVIREMLDPEKPLKYDPEYLYGVFEW